MDNDQINQRELEYRIALALGWTEILYIPRGQQGHTVGYDPVGKYINWTSRLVERREQAMESLTGICDKNQWSVALDYGYRTWRCQLMPAQGEGFLVTAKHGDLKDSILIALDKALPPFPGELREAANAQ